MGFRRVPTRRVSPPFNTWTIPLITRRSSTRDMPRVSFGSSGARRDHCSSSIRKPHSSPNSLRFGSFNHTDPSPSKKFMGPEPNTNKYERMYSFTINARRPRNTHLH